MDMLHWWGHRFADATIMRRLKGGMMQSAGSCIWKPYLITFMFKQLYGNDRSFIAQMRTEIDVVYRKLIGHIVRRPTSPSQIQSLPVLIACPDLPVPKQAKKELPEVTINNGLHSHGIMLTPPTSRLKVDLTTHFRDHEDRYLSDTVLSRMHVEPIKPNATDIADVTDYMLKSFKRGRLDYDEAILILPKAIAELP